MSSFDAYKNWSLRDARAVAPKVEVRENDNGERGLFCTDTIFPREQFLFLPETALIGESMLRQRGREILAREADLDDLNDPANAEEWATGMIEELREMVTSEEESAVKTAAQNVHYEWRSDDAVALYLLACRAIVQRVKASGVPIYDEKEDCNQETVVTNDVLPLDNDVVPIQLDTEQVTSLNGKGADASPEAISILLSETHVDGEQQRQASPSFLPHIEMLPESLPTSPLYFSPNELTRLEGTNCHGYVTRMLIQIESDWAQVFTVVREYLASPDRRMKCKDCRDDDDCQCRLILDPDHVVTLEGYKWAMCNIYSRSTDFHSFGQDGEEEHRRVIAPVFDMINHSFSSHVTHVMDEKGMYYIGNSHVSFQLRLTLNLFITGDTSVVNASDTPIEPGTEIFLNYGSFPNEKFLLVYGFVVPDNPFDVVKIYAPIQPTDPLYQIKARTLSTKCGIHDVNAPHALLRSRIGTNGILPSSLLSVLRVVGIQNTEQLLSLASRENLSQGIEMISVDNEQSALYALGHALHTMSRQLALNLISDDNLQAASNSSPASLRTMPSIAEEDEGDEDDSEKDEPAEQSTIVGPREGTSSAQTHYDEINIQNAKILCQSEYTILQAALSEIAHRLEVLENPKVTTRLQRSYSQ